MTRRFDCTADDGRLHLQSLCALAHLDFNLVGTHSYDQLFQTVISLGLGLEALQQTYRRMVFNVAGANHDDHTKNFGFLATPDGTWSLAPAFDVTHAYRSDREWTSRHLLSVNGHFEGITLEDLYAIAERHRVPAYRRVTAEVLAAVDHWPAHAGTAEVPDDVAVAIAADLDHFRPR
jgi:serine/threonine-protein kinase HipA